MRQLSPVGVIVGAVTDIVATNVAALPLGIAAGIKLAASTPGLAQLPKAEQSRLVLDTLQHTASLHVASLVIGAACSVLGGYVAARVAKRGEVLNGALSALLCVGIGVYAVATGKTAATTGPLQQAAMFVGSPALGALGGYLRLRGTRSRGDDQQQRQQHRATAAAA